MKEYKEYTKIIIKDCEFCKRKIRVLSNETSQVISVQCLECFGKEGIKPRTLK